MRKKLLVAGMLLTMTTMLFTACGNSDSNSNSNATTAGSNVSEQTSKTQNSLEHEFFILEEKNGKVVLTGLTEAGKQQTSLTIPAIVDKMGTEPFYYAGTKVLESVSFENPDIELSKMLFNNYKSLKNVTLPANLKVIPAQCFGGCGIESIVIPDSVTKIEMNAFITCYSLKSVKMSSNVTEIGSSAFAGDKALESLTLPTSVTKIGGQAFNECTSIKELTIPEGVEALDSSTFIKMHLEKLYLPKSLKSLKLHSTYGWTDDKSKLTIYAYHTTDLSADLLGKYKVEWLD